MREINIMRDLTGITPDTLPPNTLGFVGGTSADGSWRCAYRSPLSAGGLGKLNCPCARFDDGSCVPPQVYAEFVRRREFYVADLKRSGDRDLPQTFADRRAYAPDAEEG